METLVILAAAAATLLACIFVATLSKGPRRPPLRLPREEEWDDDAEAVTKALTPSPVSPIDRGAQVLDARVIEHEDPGSHGSNPRPSRTFDAEELDHRMLDHLLDQQNRELKQAERQDGPPLSEPKGRHAR
ncbi:hypothetical protein MZTS_23100 [Methylorubrum zatmanii]|nr:hypothetical protein [Methylorubrum zatmanii]MBD8909506.1 hypothetical protein [Methylorubrum zatmanii]